MSAKVVNGEFSTTRPLVSRIYNLFLLFSNISITLGNFFIKYWLSLLTKVEAFFSTSKLWWWYLQNKTKNLISYIIIVNKYKQQIFKYKHWFNHFPYATTPNLYMFLLWPNMHILDPPMLGTNLQSFAFFSSHFASL